MEPAARPGPGASARAAEAFRRRLGGLPRSFWAIWTGTLVNRTATFVRPFLVLYLTSSQHLSYATAGGVVSVSGLGSLVSQPVGGWLADRFGRRWTLAGGMAGTAATELLLGYAPNLGFTFAAAAAFGLLLDLYRPAVQAMVADLIPPRERARAYGLLFWAINLGFSIAMVLGGVLAQHGYLWLFWADAATCLAFAALVVRAVPETRPAMAPGRAAPSITVARHDRVMLALVGLSFIYATVYSQATAGLPLTMTRNGFSAAAYGLTVAANGVVIVVVQPLVVAWLARLEHSRVLAAGQLLVGAGFGLTQLAANLPEYVGTVVVWTFGEIATFTVVSALVADLAPVPLRGRYQGLLGLAWGGGGLVGPVAGASILAQSGPGWLWSGCAFLGVVTAVGHLALGPAVRHRRAALAVT